MMKLAQGPPIDLFADPAGYRGFGPLGLEGKSAYESSPVFIQFVSSAVGLISVIAIIWFVFILATGGISYMAAGSDKAAVENAKKRMSSGLIGLIITLFGLIILRLAGAIFGIPDILNINSFIQILAP